LTNIVDTLRNSLAKILFQYSQPVTFIVVLAGWMMTLGLLLTISTERTSLLAVLMPVTHWLLAYVAYSILKTYCVLFRLNPSILEVFVSSCGIFLWSYIALTFTVYNYTRVTPSDLVLFIPALAEAWSLTIILYLKNVGGK